jgi:tetratricopeptide (TPR) repeat protein
MTLFGHGYVQLGRPEEALEFYDRALKAAATVPELQFPVMTHVGRSNALIRLGRVDEADAILDRAAEAAAKAQARWYQAQLLAQRALIGFALTALQRRLASSPEAIYQSLKRPTYLSSDHDPLYRFHQWQANLRIHDVEAIKTVPCVPLSHPFVERLIGTIRRECLDRTLFWTAAVLDRR